MGRPQDTDQNKTENQKIKTKPNQDEKYNILTAQSYNPGVAGDGPGTVRLLRKRLNLPFTLPSVLVFNF